MRNRIHHVGAVFALAGSAVLSHAQTPIVAGNPLSQLPAAVPVPSPEEPTPRVAVEPPAGPSANTLAQTFTPTRFDIEGVKTLAFSEIAALFSPLVGKPTTAANLVALATQASALYANANQPLSFVYVPDQGFVDGVVRVVAVEGFIASVRVEGDAGPASDKLREIAERLVGERPMKLSTFQRVTQLLTRLPGLSVTAQASMPATTDGATVLVLKVKRDSYNLSLGADVRQPRSRAVLSGVWNDPFASGSQLSASTLLGNVSRERLLTLGYSQMVGVDGLTLNGKLSDFRGYPDQDFQRGAPIERFNTNRRVELSASYPLHLDARSSLTLQGGVYAVDNTDDYRVPARGVWLSEDTGVRAAFAQLAYLDSHTDRSRSASVLLAQGMNGLGASSKTRSNVSSLVASTLTKLDFTRLSLDVSQRDRLAHGWGTAVSMGAQYSPHSLAASERIAFGGSRFGRGYAAGDGTGDSGWGVGLELNRLFKMDFAWLKQVEPYFLAEAARVSAKFGQPTPEKLRSLAFGVRVSDAKHYSLDLAIAKPMGDPALLNPARKPRLSLQLSYQLNAL